MQEVAQSDSASRLEPLPYQCAARDFLKTHELDVWNWYSSRLHREDRVETVRLDLLKSTYRLDRKSDAWLYESAEVVAKGLHLDVPITIYQAQSPQGLNASLAYIPDQVHIVLEGSLTSKLTEKEVQALLAHEMSHFLLWHDWHNEFLVTAQILDAMADDDQAHSAHSATARLFGLYGEIFCDRGAIRAIDDPHVVIAALLKLHTELEDVNAEQYLRQAEEIVRQQDTTTDGISHPEAFIRARAIQLWSQNDPQANVKTAAMIEGSPDLDQLDLVTQQRIQGITRRLLDALLAPRWMQTDAILAHARMFIHDYQPPEGTIPIETLANDITSDHASLQDYYCYVLLDFATADSELDRSPLAAALALSEQLQIKDRLSEIARKELRLRKRQLQQIDTEKSQLLAQASQQPQQA